MRTLLTTTTFDAWFSGLRDRNAKARIAARLRRAELGNMGDCEPVGQGVSEMRIHYGPGYRVYFIQRGVELVILLAGCDKSTQSKDIKTALDLASQQQEME
jgi:putative addiction module killer protein